MAGLSAADRQWLDRYGEMLRRDYPDAVTRLAVFGSKARGEAGAKSDLDVLLLVGDAHEDRIFEIECAGYGLCAAAEGFTRPQIFGTTEGRWRRTLDDGMVFPNEVEDQAIDLIRDGVPVATAAACARKHRRAEACAQDGRRNKRGRIRKAGGSAYPTDAVDQWQQALREFRSAKWMVGDGDGRGAVSKSYYVVFHATRAALFTVGINAKTHRGTETEFERQLIQTGDLPGEWKKFYSSLREGRVVADYHGARGKHPPLSAVHDLLRRTGEYLGLIRQHLEAKGIAAADLVEDPSFGDRG